MSLPYDWQGDLDAYLVEVSKTRLCIHCKHYRIVMPIGHMCSGPHVAVSLVNGSKSMRLPAARLSTYYGLQPGVLPCGPEGRHWQLHGGWEPEPMKSKRDLLRPSWPLLVGLVITAVFATVAFFEWWKP